MSLPENDGMTVTSARRRPRLIGGMFGLEAGIASPQSRWPLLWFGERHTLLANGRGALTALAQALRPSTAWLPSYLCGVMALPFTHADIPVRFFPVDARLRVADRSWLTSVQPGDMVVFIDYFGFREWVDEGLEARRRGAWVVEDACQALLLRTFCEAAHFAFASPRKFVGVPDGGILVALGDAPLPTVAEPAPREWWMDALEASVRRASFDRRDTADRSWFDLFQRVEPGGPLQACQMSSLSRHLLRHAIPWPEIEERRQRNFRYLAGTLSEFAIFDRLPDGVSPLGFPIRLANRHTVRTRLFERDIYPPIHWPLAGIVPADYHVSHQLASEILTLPCDQRYAPEDLQEMVDLVIAHGQPCPGSR
jgi:hypothetical protein